MLIGWAVHTCANCRQLLPRFMTYNNIINNESLPGNELINGHESFLVLKMAITVLKGEGVLIEIMSNPFGIFVVLIIRP